MAHRLRLVSCKDQLATSLEPPCVDVVGLVRLSSGPDESVDPSGCGIGGRQTGFETGCLNCSGAQTFRRVLSSPSKVRSFEVGTTLVSLYDCHLGEIY